MPVPPLPRPAVPPRCIVRFDPADLPAPLRELAPEPVLGRWAAADRSKQSPRLLVALDDDGRWAGAALVTSRSGAAQVKVVDAVGDVPAVTGVVLDHARDHGAVLVKWEGWTGPPPAGAGFTSLRPPVSPFSGQPEAGYVRWLTERETGPAEPPHYQQTATFTCGAVAALIAHAETGNPDEAIDRMAEMTLWREATNFNACEPIGLGLAVQRRWPESSVSVSLDADHPVMLGYYAEPDRQWRALLQQHSRTEAERIGLPLDSRHRSVDDLRVAVDGGDRVLLLISLREMFGFDVPHWVLCHGAVPGALLLEDPWVDIAAGESWVDCHLMPVRDDVLDRMWTLEEDGCRGAVRITTPPGHGD